MTTGSANVKANTLPWPTALVSTSCPPMISIMCRLMARPSPVPPYLRVVDASACENPAKILCWLSGAMPMPESLMAKSMWATPSTTRCRCSDTTTCPTAVNLTALPPKLFKICCRRKASPSSTAGSVLSMSNSTSMPLVPALVDKITARSRINLLTANGCASSAILPASTLEKSRMSLISPRSECAAFWDLLA